MLKEYNGNYGRLGAYSSTAPIGYFIGNEKYSAVFAYVSASGYMGHGVGYYDSVNVAGGNQIAVFSTDSMAGSLIRDVADATANSVPITPGMNLEAIAYDDLSLMGYLFFWNYDGDEAQVISATGASLAAPTPIVLPPPINLQGIDHDPEFHYTRDGYVVTTQSRSQLFDLFSGEEEKAIYGGRVEQFASAYDIDGNTFYYFNGDNKTLYRCNTWW